MRGLRGFSRNAIYKNVYETQELDENRTCAKYAQVADNGTMDLQGNIRF
jgi:hypothetical protein